MTNRFKKNIDNLSIDLKKESIEILQVNLGRLCNLGCLHCHVSAGPQRLAENMSKETAEAVVAFMDRIKFSIVDLTGGAPELNPCFSFLVKEAKRKGSHVICRSNLTVFFEKDQDSTPRFLADNLVEVIASLPCYIEENVDNQRGKGVFSRSLDAIRLLNGLGYGKDDTGLILNLVYNPAGPLLPPPQKELELAYRKRLFNDYGIVFNKLYTIANMPVGRFLRSLQNRDELNSYMNLLISGFNPQVIPWIMCRNTLSVSWDGRLFDCDFNQILDFQMKNSYPLTIWNASRENLRGIPVKTGDHCFGCTAGSGSTCQGAPVK